MNLQGKPDPRIPADIQNRVPGAGKFFEASRDYGGTRRRIADHIGPDRGAAKPRHHADPHLFGSAGAGHDLLGRALLNAARIAVSPNVIGQDFLMTLIDRVRDRLADTMVAEDPHGQVVAGQKVELLLTVVGFTDSALNFEMIRAA